MLCCIWVSVAALSAQSSANRKSRTEASSTLVLAWSLRRFAIGSLPDLDAGFVIIAEGV